MYPRTVFDQILFSSDDIFYALVFIIMLLLPMLYFSYKIMMRLNFITSIIADKMGKDSEIETYKKSIFDKSKKMTDVELASAIRDEPNTEIREILCNEFSARGKDVKDIYKIITEGI